MSELNSQRLAPARSKTSPAAAAVEVVAQVAVVAIERVVAAECRSIAGVGAIEIAPDSMVLGIQRAHQKSAVDSK